MIPLKLSAIDQEHLQELYDASGIARDELPYSDAFNAALKEFNRMANATLSENEFWRALAGTAGGKRRPPPKRAAKVVTESESDEDGE